jgi:hypothetical protein
MLEPLEDRLKRQAAVRKAARRATRKAMAEAAQTGSTDDAAIAQRARTLMRRYVRQAQDER